MSSPAEASAAIKAAIARATAGHELEGEQMARAMGAILAGQAAPAAIGALLVALRMKGETPAELAQAARVMREHCVKVELPPRLANVAVVDTCGTGGDGANTFNISTAAAIVVAAAGVPVAKHGNRAASSQTGSADVLEALGISIELGPQQLTHCLDRANIAFMFARTHHPAMRHVGPVRAELGVRTLFNFLGPLSNPAGVAHQVIGVSEPRLLDAMARVLGLLGGKRALIVHGDRGLDEIALSGPTRVSELRDGSVVQREITPEDFGIATQPDADLRGGDAAHNAALIQGLLAGERGPRRDAVVINAAAALYVADAATSLAAAAALANQAIESGKARATLETWVAASKASA